MDKTTTSLAKFATSLVLAAGFILPSTAGALEVHKWIDGLGVVHYSESPPPDSVDIAGLETLELNDEYALSTSSGGDYKAILDVAERLEKSRLARERIRVEQQAREVEALRQQQSAALPYFGGGTGYPDVYPSSGYFHPSHYFRIPQDPRLGLIQRGDFVPDVRFRPFQNFSPAANARIQGGEAFPR